MLPNDNEDREMGYELEELYIEITNACNHHCLHCAPRSGRPHTNELPVRRMQQYQGCSFRLTVTPILVRLSKVYPHFRGKAPGQILWRTFGFTQMRSMISDLTRQDQRHLASVVNMQLRVRGIAGHSNWRQRTPYMREPTRFAQQSSIAPYRFCEGRTDLVFRREGLPRYVSQVLVLTIPVKERFPRGGSQESLGIAPSLDEQIA